MPTLIEISDDLAKKFALADNKKYATKHILNEINSLVYTTTKQSIEEEIKILIVQIIYELISGKKPFKSKVDEEIFIRPEHIDLFLSASDKLFKKRTIDTSFSKKRKSLLQLSVYNFSRKMQK